MKAIALLMFALFTGVANATSYGVYTPKVANAITGDFSAPLRYDLNSVAKIAALFDMMCEQVDVLSPSFAYADDKTALEINGCPSPSVRAMFRDLTETDHPHLSQDDIRTVYYAVLNFVGSAHPVSAPQATSTAVYPQWYSPLINCQELLTETTSQGVHLYGGIGYSGVYGDVESYGYGLTPSGSWATEQDIKSWCESVGIVYLCHDTGTDFDQYGFVNIGGDGDIFVTELIDDHADVMSRQFLENSYKLISNNDSVIYTISTPADDTTYGGKRSRTHYRHGYDVNAIKAFVLANATGNHLVQQEFLPTTVTIVRDEDEDIDERPNPSLVVTNPRDRLEGTVYALVHANVTWSDQGWEYYGVQPFDGGYVTSYRKRRYVSAVTVTGTEVKMPTEPLCVVTLAVDRNDEVRISGGRRVYSCGEGIRNKPEYFRDGWLIGVADSVCRYKLDASDADWTVTTNKLTRQYPSIASIDLTPTMTAICGGFTMPTGDAEDTDDDHALDMDANSILLTMASINFDAIRQQESYVFKQVVTYDDPERGDVERYYRDYEEDYPRHPSGGEDTPPAIDDEGNAIYDHSKRKESDTDPSAEAEQGWRVAPEAAWNQDHAEGRIERTIQSPSYIGQVRFNFLRLE